MTPATLRSAYLSEALRGSKETSGQHEKRIARYESEQRRNRHLLKEMTKSFDFSLRGEGVKDGLETYILDIAPQMGYTQKDCLTRVLTAMHGTIWIDKQSFGWVRTEAVVVHPVMVEDFFARVEKGTR